jgi:hypothetical protein
MIEGMYGVGYRGPVYNLSPRLGRFDRAFAYMYQEMFSNPRSGIVANIGSWNEISSYAVSNRDFWLLPHVADWNAAALTAWASKVAPGRDWDHKPKLDALLGLGSDPDGEDYYFPVFGDTKHEVYYDIWSNIHYGYVGSAAGFDPDTLQSGAAEAVLAGRTDQADILTVQIGIDLWNQNGLNLSAEQLWLAILDHLDELLALSEAESGGLDRVIDALNDR